MTKKPGKATKLTLRVGDDEHVVTATSLTTDEFAAAINADAAAEAKRQIPRFN